MIYYSMKKITMLFIFSLFLFIGQAQDTAYVKAVVRKLASPEMYGRGYAYEGGKLTAEFIRDEFQKMGLEKIHGEYFQKFKIPMNIFEDSLKVQIDGKDLIPGSEFVLASSSPSVDGTFELVWDTTFGYSKIGDVLSEKIKSKLKEKVVITQIPAHNFTNGENPFSSAGIISISENKLSWHVSDGYKVNDYFVLSISKQSFSEDTRQLKISAKSKFQKNYPIQNIAAYIPGSEYPDSFFVFTAHYDHLGQMGPRTYFPGANDNASGTAMLLDLARHYSQPENQSKFSMLFIAFAAEEAGLLGSFYFAQHPLVPLERFVFLINLDMVGSGSEGIKVVNGGVFKKPFERLQQINSENGFLKVVSKRGEAANSDHFPFYKQGVPCFFIYTLGSESPEYHSIYDTPKNVPFTEYSGLFQLLESFVKTY